MGRSAADAAVRVGTKIMLWIRRPTGRRTYLQILTAVLWSAVIQPSTEAADIHADPSNYRTHLPALRAGDTLHLAAGTYSRLPVTKLNGTPDGWITITGPESGAPAVISGASGSNTVEI